MPKTPWSFGSFWYCWSHHPLDRLETTFGIKDTVLKWIASFLIGRMQQVAIGDLGTDLRATSDPLTMTCGVPQGSVLDPILFTLYTVPLGKICSKHHISYLLYADDTQLYLTFKPNRNGSEEACTHGLKNCINEIREWVCMNLLKLNDGKTEFIILGTQQQLQKISHISIQIGEDLVTPVDMVWNLGFFMDKYLKYKDHINRITSNTYNILRKIHQPRSLLDKHTTKIIVQALVLSKLDYCNSLLLGSPEYQMDKLQHIQNMTCRVIFQLRKHDHIMQYLKLLHWLKRRERIAYKIAFLIHKCKDNQVPVYLQQLLPSKHHESLLRSSMTEYLNSDICKNTHTLRSSFSAAGPRYEIYYHWTQKQKNALIPSRRSLKLIFLKYHVHKILYFIYVNTNFNVKCPRSGSHPVFGVLYKCNYYYFRTVSNYRLVIVSINQQLLPAGIDSSNNDYYPLNAKNTTLKENPSLIFSFSGGVTGWSPESHMVYTHDPMGHPNLWWVLHAPVTKRLILLLPEFAYVLMITRILLLPLATKWELYKVYPYHIFGGNSMIITKSVTNYSVNLQVLIHGPLQGSLAHPRSCSLGRSHH